MLEGKAKYLNENIEQFDGLGHYRTLEGGAQIDPSGELDGVGFADAWELTDAIAHHEDLAGCMARTMLAYASGHSVTDGEEAATPGATLALTLAMALTLAHVWPDAYEVGRVWRPELGIPASPAEVMRGLLQCGAPAEADKRRGWVDGLHKIHRSLLAEEWEPTDDGVNFAAVVCEVDKHLAPDATVTTDAGNFASTRA